MVQGGLGMEVPWQVLIVEDDERIASIYRRTVTEFDFFEVAGVVTRGEDALSFLRRRSCDLILLDLKLAGMNGLKVLQQVRADGREVEVIALTATRTSAAVRTVIQRGAIDYLVKPFTIERLRQSLGLFINRATALRREQLDQTAIDRACASGRVLRRWLPKGLTDEGVARVLRVLDGGGAVSAADVAAVTGLSRVTARRYLEYLVTIHRVSVHASAVGPGRPRKFYELLA